MPQEVPSSGMRHQPRAVECKNTLPWQLQPALSPSLSQIPGEELHKAAPEELPGW